MDDILLKFTEISARPNEWLKNWKETHDKKLVGVSPMHFPEEIVHAAGMQPAVIQESAEPVTFGHSLIYPNFCAWTRGTLDMLLKEKLNFFDALLFFDECVEVRATRIIAGNRIPFPYYWLVQPPSSLKVPTAQAQAERVYERLRVEMQKLVGHEITDQALKESILIYNKNRSLLRKLYDIRRAKPGALRAKEVLAIVQSSMIMPKEEHSELLEKLLPRLEAREPRPDGKVRLVLSGHYCTAPKTDMLDIIEDAGGVIVDDDLYTGFRYFAMDVPVNGSPIQALVEHYMANFPPNPSRWDPDNDLAEYLIDVVQKDKAQGVIALMAKHCELHNWYSLHIRRKLTEAGIPSIWIDTEHETVSLGPERTRIEAFLEMIKAGAPA